jgi:hypothetical protein
MKTRHHTTRTHFDSPSPNSSPVRLSRAIRKQPKTRDLTTVCKPSLVSRKVSPASSSPSTQLRVGSVDALAVKTEGGQLVHYALKNKEFYFELSLRSSSPSCVSFHNLALVASLHYDLPERREVTSVRSVPLAYRVLSTADYNSTSTSAASLSSVSSARVEFKCSVLTTQHEGILFRARLSLRDPTTGEELCSCFSPALRVISKLEQLKPRSERVPRRQTKTATERIQANLESIRALQSEQQALLQRLLSVGTSAAAAVAAAPTTGAQSAPPRTTRASSASSARRRSTVAHSMQPQEPAASFAQRLRELLTAYDSLPVAERPLLVARSVDSLNPQQTTAVNSLVRSVLHNSLHPVSSSTANAAATPHSTEASSLPPIPLELAQQLAPFCVPTTSPSPSTSVGSSEHENGMLSLETASTADSFEVPSLDVSLSSLFHPPAPHALPVLSFIPSLASSSTSATTSLSAFSSSATMLDSFEHHAAAGW